MKIVSGRVKIRGSVPMTKTQFRVFCRQQVTETLAGPHPHSEGVKGSGESTADSPLDPAISCRELASRES